LRAYVLSVAGAPAAYWLVATYNGTLLLKTTGYDPAYARDRVGIYLLMRVIEDACADPTLNILDFGPGDASYKRHFSSESFEERNALVYAPTLRALRINATRTGLLGAGLVAHRVLEASGMTDRLRKLWRARRRESAA
jgi:CelD/BcsL family acetyltransferase involved in cellulose biosynthesis